MTFHCFFEQSGTFKNEFKKLGYDAEDYDILNDFGETDHVIDLFAEIEKAYEGGLVYLILSTKRIRSLRSSLVLGLKIKLCCLSEDRISLLKIGMMCKR